MGFFAAYRKQLSNYQLPDGSHPLSWGAVRENIEQASNRDFLKRSKGLNSDAFSKIQKLFLRQPSKRTEKLERPGFLQGLNDAWFSA